MAFRLPLSTALLAAAGLALAASCSEEDSTPASTTSSSSSSSSSSSTGGDAPDGSDELAVAEDFSKAYCEFDEACRLAAFRIEYNDRARCIERSVEVYLRAFQRPHGADLPGQLVACAARIRELGCEWQNNDPACVLKGDLANGAVCAYGTQCTSGVCERFVAQCGKCTEPAQAGESCDERPCTKGVREHHAGDGGTGPCTCIVAPREGQTCSAELPCAPGLKCVSSVCKKPLPRGATCVRFECDLDKDESCIDGVCSPTPRVGPGGKCTADIGCLASECVNGTCILQGEVGNRCGPPSCRLGLECQPKVDGTKVCVERAADDCFTK